MPNRLSQCAYCAFLDRSNPDADAPTCLAFPEEIPYPILTNQHDHRNPYPYQPHAGVTFVPLTLTPPTKKTGDVVTFTAPALPPDPPILSTPSDGVIHDDRQVSELDAQITAQLAADTAPVEAEVAPVEAEVAPVEDTPQTTSDVVQ